MSVLNTIAKSVSSAVSVNNVNDEVAALLDVSRNKVTIFEAIDEFLANELVNLPKIDDRNVVVHHVNTRGFSEYNVKSLSDCLWILALGQLKYQQFINYEMVVRPMVNWFNEHVRVEHMDLGRVTYSKVNVTIEDLQPIAVEVVAAMTAAGIVEANITKATVRSATGQLYHGVKVKKITEEFKNTLNGNIDALRTRAVMTCRPMMYQPMDWTDAVTGVGENAGLTLVKGNGEYKVKKRKVADKVLSAVNKLQRVKFTVAECIVSAAKDIRLNKAMYQSDAFKGLFSGKELQKEAFDIYAEIEQYVGKEFYFPVTLDKRGRMYYRGGLLSPQGVDFCKAAFQFASYKKLGKYGFKALCLHTANVCGQDKISINNRVRWVRDNWSTIMTVGTHMDVRKAFKDADVFQALVACKELQRLDKLEGEWSEKTSNLVCHQDGTCNGLQHMAAITGDRPTAVAVNCVPSTHDDQPSDIYGIVAKAAAKLATDDAARMLILKHGRSMAKNPVMVTGYGATESTIKNNTADFLARKNEDVSKAEAIADAYLEAIAQEAGAVTQLTEAITTRMQYALADGKKKFTWITADGFVASTMYEVDEEFVVRVGDFHIRKRGMGKAPVDTRKTAQAMSPNFIHSIDSTHLRAVVNQCDHELVTVHDSIGAHACDYFTTARTVRETFAVVHKGYDALGDLCFVMNQEVPKFDEKNDYDASEALQSSYIFS